MKIRKYLWILNFVGGIIILVSVFTPTSFNDTTPTLYYVWMNQIGVDIDPLDIYLLRTDVMLVFISTILAVLLFSAGLLSVTLTATSLRNTVPFKKLQWKAISFAILAIASSLSWIVMMESFYNIYGYNHWVDLGGGYSPYFGVIGPFIGAPLLIAGSFARRA
jgi:hypothetical protein